MDKKTFAYHPASEPQQKALDATQAVFNATLEVIENCVPEGRYRSIAITQLELAGAMAAKGIFKKSDGSAIDSSDSSPAQSSSGWKHTQGPKPVTVTTVEFIATLCHEANRSYCESMGDHSQLPWKEAPDWQRKSCINGVEFHLKNPGSSPSASHEAWLAEKEREGWKYGPVKDVEKKEHPCYVPYDELPAAQKAKDYIFSGLVRAVVDQLGGVVQI